MAEDESDVCYEAADGSKMSCSQKQAHIWLYRGFFTSATRFALKGRDGRLGEWMTLDELTSRNGREMPFCEWKEGENDVDEKLNKVKEELDDILERKERLQRTLDRLKKRDVGQRIELHRIKEYVSKYPDEARAIMHRATPAAAINGERRMSEESKPKQKSAKPTAAVSGIRKEPQQSNSPKPPAASIEVVVGGSEASPPPAIYPQITPAKGVDPFAILKCSPTAKRKMEGDFVNRIKELGIRFGRCDKQRLTQQTTKVFGSIDNPWCSLCKVKFQTVSVFIMHVSSQKHIYALKGQICADSFDFWWNVVDEANGGRSVFEDPERKPEPEVEVRVRPESIRQPPPGFESRSEPAFSRRAGPGFGPRPEPSYEPIAPPNLPGLEMLRRERRRVERPCLNAEDELSRLARAFKSCDKRKLDSDPATADLFIQPLLCLVCNRCAVDKPSNMVAHITGAWHMDAIFEQNVDVPQSAIDFWMRAVLRARS